MFMLYALPLGLVLGLLMGGHLAGLSTVRFRWSLVFVLGLLVQLVLFSEPVTARVGEMGPPIYVASTLLVFVALAGNVRIPGVPIVLAGAASNLAAILANGGYMPASPTALAAIGHVIAEDYTNSTVLPRPALEPLTDIFAMPAWMPWNNVFSIGDVLIGVGIVVVVVLAMRRAGGGAPAHIRPLG